MSDGRIETGGLEPLDDGPGPALQLQSEQRAAMVDAALDAWTGAEPRRAPVVNLRPRSSRARWAAAAIVLVGGAAAASYLQLRGDHDDPTAVVPTASPAAVPHAPPRPSVIAPSSPAEPEAEPEAAPPHAAETPVPPGKPLAPPARSAQDWLRRANELRTAGQWREAERTYAKVYRAYPGSGAAYVARIAAATLRLEHLGDPAGARRLLRRAAGSGRAGALDVEIQTGIAQASRRLADRAGEIAALRLLVTRHGGTRAGARARDRLTELGESE